GGTSMAAPHVTGVISLMLSLKPELTRDDVVQILRQSARSFGDSSCTTSTCGAGIVNAAAALRAVQERTPTPTRAATRTPSPAHTGRPAAHDAVATGPDTVEYSWRRGPGGLPNSYRIHGSDGVLPYTPEFELPSTQRSFTQGSMPAGVHYARVTGVNARGEG